MWNNLRDELESYYKDKPRQHLPLSQQKEFKAIKNMVIREAENLRLGVLTFEDERIENPTWGQIRAGDLVRFDTETSGHVVVVLNKNDEYSS